MFVQVQDAVVVGPFNRFRAALHFHIWRVSCVLVEGWLSVDWASSLRPLQCNWRFHAVCLLFVSSLLKWKLPVVYCACQKRSLRLVLLSKHLTSELTHFRALSLRVLVDGLAKASGHQVARIRFFALGHYNVAILVVDDFADGCKHNE